MLEIGERIRQCRERIGMTQDELAQATGYKSRSSINKIEKGGNDLPQSKIVIFAKALSTTPSYLMGWEELDTRFGDIIKNRRLELGLSLEEIAQKTGLSVNSIILYENNQRQPSDLILGYFREALEIDLPARAHNGYWDFKDDIDIALDEKIALLNDIGKNKALDYISDLTEQSKYIIDENKRIKIERK